MPWAQQLAAVNDSGQTPSARLLADLDRTGLEFSDYGLQTAHHYQEYFAGLSNDLNQHAELFATEQLQSLKRQEELNKQIRWELDEYILVIILDWLLQRRICPAT